MPSLAEVEKIAFALSERERGLLASSLLQSLRGAPYDDDEGVQEALRRDAELDADPSRAITLDDLKKEFGHLEA